MAVAPGTKKKKEKRKEKEDEGTLMAARHGHLTARYILNQLYGSNKAKCRKHNIKDETINLYNK